MLFDKTKKYIRRYERGIPEIKTLYEVGCAINRLIINFRSENPDLNTGIKSDYIYCFYLGALELLMRSTIGADVMVKITTPIELALYIALKQKNIEANEIALAELETTLAHARKMPQYEKFWRLGLAFFQDLYEIDDKSGCPKMALHLARLKNKLEKME